MIDLVKEKRLCAGCGACSLICPVGAIEMKSDKLEFMYPEISAEKCVECGKCKDRCPVKNPLKENNFELYALKHKSGSVRLNSSSGGAFTLISDYILTQNGRIYGAVYDEKFNIVHSCAATADERNLQRGSKYIQSEAFRCFEKAFSDIKAGKKVLFVGTPCQIAGFKTYINGEYDNLILCDLICHGVASPAVWSDYIKFIEKKYGTFSSFKFRDKSISWHGYNISVIKSNGKKLCNTRALKIASEIYCSHVCTREACHSCHFTSINRVSDITIADFWGIEKSKKDFEDNLGVSIAFLNTDKGKKLFNSVKGNSLYEKISLDDVRQPQLYHPAKAALAEKKFFDDYKNMSFVALSKKYFNYGIIAATKEYLKKLLVFLKLDGFVRNCLKK